MREPYSPVYAQPAAGASGAREDGSPLKIAVQTPLIPGKTTADKAAWAQDHGIDAFEIQAWQIDPVTALKEYRDSPVPVAAVCGNPTFDFLDPDPEKRQRSIEQSKEYLKLAGDLGAVGQIVPPIFGPPRINDLSPWMDAVSLEKRLLVEICRSLGKHAAQHNTLLMLEPLNRYEQHLLRRLADAAEIIEECGHPAVKLIGDLFHMHIEETDTPAAIRAAGEHIAHMHLADNTRLEPGTGDIDFVAAFRALREVGFDGYLAFECSLSGDDPAASLAASVAYVRECLSQA